MKHLLHKIKINLIIYLCYMQYHARFYTQISKVKVSCISIKILEVIYTVIFINIYVILNMKKIKNILKSEN